MDIAILTAIISAAAALLGAALASRSQLRAARESHDAQHHLESMKIAAAAKEKQRTDIAASYIEIHKALSYISREFSLTSVSIMLDAKISKHDYDRKYLEICERMDIARAFVEVHYPDAFKVINEVYGQMNIFWGHFSEVSTLSISGQSPQRRQEFQDKANLVSLDIVALAQKAKNQLTNMARATLQ